MLMHSYRLFSAVDSHVSQHIFEHLICDFLSDRTRILVTHQIATASTKADLMICLDSNGEVVACCHPSQLKETISNNKTFLSRHSTGDSENILMPSNARQYDSSSMMKPTNSFTFLSDAINDIELVRQSSREDNSSKELKEEEETMPFDQMDKSMDASMNHSIRLSSANDSAGSNKEGKITDIEQKREGEVPLSIYWFYTKACGGIYLVVTLLLVTISLIAST